MNKKGFTITVILYAMVLLISVIFVLLLGTLKNRYKTNTKLQDNIMHSINVSNGSRIAIMPVCNELVYNGDFQELASGGSNIYIDNNIGREVGYYHLNVKAEDYYTFSDGTNEKILDCVIKMN